MRKTKYISIIIVAVLILNTIVFAASKQDLRNQQNNLSDKIRQQQEKIGETHDELSATLKEIQKINAQISDYQAEINELQKQENKVQEKLIKTKEELKKAEKEYNRQKEMLQNRLVALYEAGETTYLDVLLTSADLTDFISNYYLISELASYDTELLDQMDKSRKEIQQVKDDLQESKDSIVSLKESKERTESALQNSQDTKKQYASTLTSKEKKQQTKLEQFERDKAAVTSKLAQIAYQESQKNGGNEYVTVTPNNSGYIFPVAGYGLRKYT